ncbi:hypothetical protein NDN08_005371 [Rhodosorus marinus]|uniref:Vacuolar protein-sorting-associated protein 36 n=1 Tax=Rhodosorus marinus TaxID=101924 RepID=A0AAV8V571_9RHOD|nr:hypothetical protein NDN08_005371 [Rhodosorus marinus]
MKASQWLEGPRRSEESYESDDELACVGSRFWFRRLWVSAAAGKHPTMMVGEKPRAEVNGVTISEDARQLKNGGLVVTTHRLIFWSKKLCVAAKISDVRAEPEKSKGLLGLRITLTLGVAKRRVKVDFSSKKDRDVAIAAISDALREESWKSKKAAPVANPKPKEEKQTANPQPASSNTQAVYQQTAVQSQSYQAYQQQQQAPPNQWGYPGHYQQPYGQPAQYNNQFQPYGYYPPPNQAYPPSQAYPTSQMPNQYVSGPPYYAQQQQYPLGSGPGNPSPGNYGGAQGYAGPEAQNQTAGEGGFNPVQMGVGGLIAREKQKEYDRGKALNAAFTDLDGLMNNAKELVIIAQKFKTLRAQESDIAPEDEEFQAMMAEIGIDDPVSKTSIGNDRQKYYDELSKQLGTFLVEPLDRMGGVLTLTDVYCVYNRARNSTELVAPEDVFKACERFEMLGVELKLTKLDSNVLIVESRDFRGEKGAQRVLEATEERGSLSPMDLANESNIPLGLALEQLQNAERLEKLCRDEGGLNDQGVLRFYPNLFHTQYAKKN